MLIAGTAKAQHLAFTPTALNSRAQCREAHTDLAKARWHKGTEAQGHKGGSLRRQLGIGRQKPKTRRQISLTTSHWSLITNKRGFHKNGDRDGKYPEGKFIGKCPPVV